MQWSRGSTSIQRWGGFARLLERQNRSASLRTVSVNTKCRWLRILGSNHSKDHETMNGVTIVYKYGAQQEKGTSHRLQVRSAWHKVWEHPPSTLDYFHQLMMCTKSAGPEHIESDGATIVPSGRHENTVCNIILESSNRPATLWSEMVVATTHCFTYQPTSSNLTPWETHLLSYCNDKIFFLHTITRC